MPVVGRCQLQLLQSTKRCDALLCKMPTIFFLNPLITLSPKIFSSGVQVAA